MDNEFLDINMFADNDDGLLTDPLALFIQEITLGVKIAPGEIWGIYDSIDLKKYLFNQYITINKIKNEVQEFISKNCIHSLKFNYDVNAQIINVDNKELIYISVHIFSEDKEYVQKFLLGE